MFKKKPSPKKEKADDKYATQEQPVIISHPLSDIPIIIGNLDLDDEYKTEPFPPSKEPQRY